MEIIDYKNFDVSLLKFNKNIEYNNTDFFLRTCYLTCNSPIFIENGSFYIRFCLKDYKNYKNKIFFETIEKINRIYKTKSSQIVLDNNGVLVMKLKFKNKYNTIFCLAYNKELKIIENIKDVLQIGDRCTMILHFQNNSIVINEIKINTNHLKNLKKMNLKQ